MVVLDYVNHFGASAQALLMPRKSYYDEFY